MSTVIMNDVAMEAKVGERLLNVARRNAAHIGFVCDNAGTCQGCRCQVLAGAEYLSPPSDAEKAWIPADRLAEGQRLACQAIVRGDGEVRVLSRAEELRRLLMAVVAPPSGRQRLANVQPLVKTLATQVTDQLALFPGNVLSTIWRVGPLRFATPVKDGKRTFDDIQRVVQQMRSGGAPIERRPRSSAKSLAPVPIVDDGSAD